MSQYGRTFLFSCYVAAYRYAIIIQIMCYAVKVVKPSHYIRNFKRRISTDMRKFSLPVRTFSSEISTGKNNSVQLGQNFQNPLPTKLVRSLKPHFCPSWTEVKSQLRHKLCRSQESLLRNLQRSLDLTSTQVV